MSKRRKYLTEAEFKQIKALQEVGLSVAKTARVVDRSQGAVASVFKAASLKEHLRLQSARRSKYYTPKEAPVQTELKGGHDVPVPSSPMLVEILSNVRDLAADMSQVIIALNSLIEAEEQRVSAAKVNGWRFGRSR